MSKKPIIGGIILAAIIGVVFAGAQINPDNPENGEVWSIRMASPEWDDRQTVRASLPNLEEGTYKIGFVPMGDSPHKITIVIKGKSTTTSPNFYFSEEFVLKGTPIDTGISKYYTWEYVGYDYDVYIPEGTLWGISITRTGNLEGSVTISLSQ